MISTNQSSARPAFISSMAVGLNPLVGDEGSGRFECPFHQTTWYRDLTRYLDISRSMMVLGREDGDTETSQYHRPRPLTTQNHHRPTDICGATNVLTIKMLEDARKTQPPINPPSA